MNERTERHLEEPFGGAWDEQPWPLAFELANALPPGSWTLVGGLMVQVRAALTNLPLGRETTDVDGVLHLETGSIGFAHAERLLRNAGFTLVTSTKYAYRFTRERDTIDLMVSDRLAASQHPTFQGRPLFGIPGGTRALSSTENLTMVRDGLTLARLSIPSLQGAMVLKGAAYLEDSRDRGRHVEDGIVLMACVGRPDDIRSGLSPRSRKRVRALLKGAGNNREAWFSVHPRVRERALQKYEELEAVFNASGTGASASTPRTTR